MRVLIAGDVHGLIREFAQRVEQACRQHDVRAVIQLGDFGFYPEVIQALLDEQVRFAVPVHALDGNHEDHRWLEVELRNKAVARWRDKLNLFYQPRPSVARFGSALVGFLGGALNVDRPQELNRRAKSSNYILRRQRRVAVEIFNRLKPDLIATHSCPSGIGVGIHGNPLFASSVLQYVVEAGFNPGPEDDCGDEELTRLWENLRQKPKAWVFGHFHLNHFAQVENTQFACADCCCGKPRQPLLIWDTEEKTLLALK
jgi:hypothetical protein